MPLLKDGSELRDPRLDRLVQFDERSRQFGIRQTLTTDALRSYTWRCSKWLDQGREGACVGFALSHEIAARPLENRAVTDQSARELYYAAQRLDPWEGGEYPGASPNYSGTSVLAGLKVAKAQGHFSEYRWAFGLRDVLLGVGYRGPCVIGVNWYDGMYSPDSEGFIHVRGNVVGGHCILINSVNAPGKFVWLHNSWGADWGVKGRCKLSFDDLERLLHEDGEAAFVSARKWVTI